MKSIFLSKTFWLQVAAVASLLIPQVKAWLAANPESFVVFLGAANVALRFVTSGKVSLAGAEDFAGGGKLPGWGVLLASGGLCGLCGFSQTSCTTAGKVPIKTCVITDYGTVCYSSKSGIDVTVNGQAVIDRHSGK